jgi:acyl-CoA thioesterase
MKVSDCIFARQKGSSTLSKGMWLEGTGMEHIKRFFKKDRFADYVGIELLEASEGSARARMEIKDHHLNAVGIVHGAAIFTLADLVFAVASNSHGNVAVAVNANISFLKANSQGAFFAEATEVSRNSKLASYTVRVTDESDNLIAIFQGMVYRKKDKIG